MYKNRFVEENDVKEPVIAEELLCGLFLEREEKDAKTGNYRVFSYGGHLIYSEIFSRDKDTGEHLLTRTRFNPYAVGTAHHIRWKEEGVKGCKWNRFSK